MNIHFISTCSLLIHFKYYYIIAMTLKAKPLKVFLLLFLTMSAWFNFAFGQPKFEKAAFYEVMSSGDIKATEAELIVAENSSSPNKEGYEGALLMKKAGMIGKPGQKLKFFKEGRIKLETALMADKDNTEYHFLRLAIEEHAPKIVKYHADIDADKLIIKNNFKNLSPVVQHAIIDYCKNSKVLHAEDFSPR